MRIMVSLRVAVLHGGIRMNMVIGVSLLEREAYKSSISCVIFSCQGECVSD